MSHTISLHAQTSPKPQNLMNRFRQKVTERILGLVSRIWHLGPTRRSLWPATSVLFAFAALVARADPPSVVLNSPSDQTVTLGTSLTISTDASDPDGDMTDHNIDIQRPDGSWNYEGWGQGMPYQGIEGDGYNSSKSLSFSFNQVGTWHVRAAANDGSGWVHTSDAGVAINVVAANHAPFGSFDNVTSSVRMHHTISGNGWAADEDTGAPVAKVQILIDGALKAEFIPSGYRPDVASAFGRNDYTNSGWSFSFDLDGSVGSGDHTIEAIAYDSAGAHGSCGVKSFNVPVEHAPFGYFDVLTDSAHPGQTITGSGWAVDEDTGAPVSHVDVILDGGAPLEISGNGYRGDVAAAYNRSDYTNSGWSFSMTVGDLKPGPHTIQVALIDDTGLQGTCGSKTFTVLANQAPQITTQPTSVTAPVGGSATFTVAANGYPVPTFQWYKTGVAIPGATSASLTLSNLAPSDSTYYYAVASNSAGSTSSINATLTVAAATVTDTSGTYRWIHDATYTTGMGSVIETYSEEMRVGPNVILQGDATTQTGANVAFVPGIRLKLLPGTRIQRWSKLDAFVYNNKPTPGGGTSTPPHPPSGTDGDSDGDGIPDELELAAGLNPNDPTDAGEQNYQRYEYDKNNQLTKGPSGTYTPDEEGNLKPNAP
jgi:hypothetical protein